MTPSSFEKIWGTAQELLRTMLNPDIYNLWFRPVRATTLEKDVLTLEVANDFCEVWLKDNYVGLLKDVVTHAAGQPLQVKFRVASASVPPAVVAPELPKPKAKASTDERSNGAPREVVFNPKNTFENFVVGETNNHSYAAAFAVAQTPGKAYNPLFVYGGVG